MLLSLLEYASRLPDSRDAALRENDCCPGRFFRRLAEHGKDIGVANGHGLSGAVDGIRTFEHGGDFCQIIKFRSGQQTLELFVHRI